MGISGLRVSRLAATKRFGGNASSAMSGKQPSATGRWAGAVRTARTRRLTIQIASLPRIQSWWPNGIQQGTATFDLNSSLPAAEGESGGSVQQRMTMNGRPRSIKDAEDMDVHTVVEFA
jgi:hypothetical protein